MLVLAALCLAPLAGPAPRAQAVEIELRARLLDSQGVELARERVHGSVKASGSSIHYSWGGSEKTNGQGRFAWSFGPADAAVLAAASLELELSIERKDGSAWLGVRQLSEPEEGRIDLGDLKLEPAPVMVFGRVLDPEGKPLANETVSFSGVSTWQAQKGMPAGAERRAADVQLKTDAQGRFELRGIDRGLAPASRREVRACSLVYPPTRWLPFGGPDAEVVLQFSPPAFLQGRVVVPEGVDPRSLRLDASYQGELPWGDAERAKRLEKDGSFRLCLAAEPSSLALWLDDEAHSLQLGDAPSLVREGVVPGAEDLTWDLRDTLHVYELAVLTPDGKPAPSPELYYSSGGKSLYRPFAGLQGRPLHRVISLDRPLEVRVEEEGFRTSSATLDAGRGEVHLVPGIAVGVAIANHPDLGADGWLSIEALVKEGVNPRAHADLDPRGSGQLVLPEPGSYTVQLQYQRRVGPAIWFGATSLGFDLGTLEVADREQQTFALILPSGLVDVFLREAAQRR